MAQRVLRKQNTALCTSPSAIDMLHRATSNASAEHIEALEMRLHTPVEDVCTFADALPGPRMLDLGCGAGRYVDEFLYAGLDYVGIDISTRHLDIARARNPGSRFHLMSYRKLFRFGPKSFDGVWSCCVLNHEPKENMPTVLAELHRVLAPGGILSIIFPDCGEVSEGFGSTYPTHLTSYFAYWGLEEFARVLNRAGFMLFVSELRWSECALVFHAKKI